MLGQQISQSRETGSIPLADRKLSSGHPDTSPISNIHMGGWQENETLRTSCWLGPLWSVQPQQPISRACQWLLAVAPGLEVNSVKDSWLYLCVLECIVCLSRAHITHSTQENKLLRAHHSKTSLTHTHTHTLRRADSFLESQIGSTDSLAVSGPVKRTLMSQGQELFSQHWQHQGRVRCYANPGS